MSVQDKFVNALVAAGKKAPSYFARGGQLLVSIFNFEVASGDSDGSVYRLARLPANAIPVRCEIYSDAITSGSDYDLGLYKPGVGGAIVDGNIFLDGGDPSGGKAITSPLNGLTNLGGADPVGSYGKQIWELLGLSAPDRQDYDLAFTANTVGSADGTISGFFSWLIG